MPKLFVISDIHGFYYEMIEALNEAGFDPLNENHWLISCGDELDRGSKPTEVLNYLMNLPRAVFIKGNHQTLMEELLERGYPVKYDWSNGTMQSVIDLAPSATTTNDAFNIVYHKVKQFFNSTVNYFETKNYIFVHSFIPLKCNDNVPMYYAAHSRMEFNPDWRTAHYNEWEDVRWCNPYKLAMEGFLPDKTLVFGHWHTSHPRHILNGEPEFGEDADFSIYYGDGYIGIDGCTAYTGKVNVLVLEDDFINDDYPCNGHECYDKGNYHASCTTCPLHK